MKFNKPQQTIVFCSMLISSICGVLWDKMLIVVPLLLIFIGVGLYKKYFGKTFAFILILFFTLTALYTNAREPVPDTLSYYDNQDVTLEGKVISLPDKSAKGKTRFEFEVYKLINSYGEERKIYSKTQVFLDENITAKISRGDDLRLGVYIMKPKTYNNPGEFDYGKYLSNYNIFTLAFASEVEIFDTEPLFKHKILNFIDKIREKIIFEHEKYLDGKKVEILGGIVFGSEAIKPSLDIKTTFINSGLYHLLAASGMNVAFIFGIWFFIFKRLRAPYNFIIISGGIVVLFYAMMTGLPPSVTRATWMLELALLGKLIDRNSDNTLILLLVCASLLIYNPLMLNDIGFLLSFMVTFGLINCAPPLIEATKPIPARISGWIIIPFVAQLFAAPIQMFFFQTFSLYSIIANMLVVPFMAVISFCGFISSILALIPKIGTHICFILDKVNEPFLTFLLFVANKISELPNNTIHVAKLHFAEIILCYLLIFVFIYMVRTKFKNIYLNIGAGLLTIIMLLSFVLHGKASDLSFTFLNVGEGDSIFVVTPNNKKILVDTGKNYGRVRNSASSIILPYLKIHGITTLDALILTHPDSDHIAGSVDILENLDVKKLITNGEKAKNRSYYRLQDYIVQNKLKEHIISNSEEISPDEEVSILAIKPTNINDKTQNDTSIILLFKYKDFDAILMGDNEVNSFEQIKNYLNPTGSVELFKVGHHGSYSSVNRTMAEFLAPKVSVISVGENSYGHPHARVLSCLNKSRIYRTDLDNTIKIRTDGENFEVYTYNPKKSRWCKDCRVAK